jgi:hypothetical protein
LKDDLKCKTQMVNTTGPITVVAKWVGAHYDSLYQGNTVVFMVDKILSDEYPYSGYGFCINVGDQTTANSGISMFRRA